MINMSWSVTDVSKVFVLTHLRSIRTCFVCPQTTRSNVHRAPKGINRDSLTLSLCRDSAGNTIVVGSLSLNLWIPIAVMISIISLSCVKSCYELRLLQLTMNNLLPSGNVFGSESSVRLVHVSSTTAESVNRAISSLTHPDCHQLIPCTNKPP